VLVTAAGFCGAPREVYGIIVLGVFGALAGDTLPRRRWLTRSLFRLDPPHPPLVGLGLPLLEDGRAGVAHRLLHDRQQVLGQHLAVLGREALDQPRRCYK
jgi:hypothetical protein